MTLQQKVENYVVPKQAVDLIKNTKLLLVAGIVSAGKDTVVTNLAEDPAFKVIVSHTTRPPRMNHGVLEQDGVEYHFIDLAEAEAMLERGEFVEAKYVHGNIYGTSLKEIRAIHDQGVIGLTDIDIHGVEEYLKIDSSAHAIFLLPPSVDTWTRRLEKRYGELDLTSVDIRNRLATAAAEIEYIRNSQKFVVIINDDLDTTLNRIRQVVAGEKTHTSEYAEFATDHLLEYIHQHI